MEIIKSISEFLFYCVVCITSALGIIISILIINGYDIHKQDCRYNGEIVVNEILKGVKYE